MLGKARRRPIGLIFDFVAYCTAVCYADLYAFVWRWLRPVAYEYPETPADKVE